MTELYASALHLDRAAVKSLKITDPYSLHRVVYSLFPDVRTVVEKSGHMPSGIVYARQGGDVNGSKVLIVSDRAPAEQVEGKYGRVISKPIAESFLNHSDYRFKVQVNPVRKDKRTGRRVAVKGSADIADWITQRADSNWGFDVDRHTLQVDAIEVLQFKAKSDRAVTVGIAHIQGRLSVTDTQKFQKSFKYGIGKARAFGCGLLQIVPIIDNPFA